MYYDAPYYLDSWQRQRFAHTSPVYVSTGGDWRMWNDATAQYMLTMIEGNLSYVRRRASSEPADGSGHSPSRRAGPTRRIWSARS